MATWVWDGSWCVGSGWWLTRERPQLAALPSITEGIGLHVASQGKDPTSKSQAVSREHILLLHYHESKNH